MLDEQQETHPAVTSATSSRASSGMGGAGAYVLYCVPFLPKSWLSMTCWAGRVRPSALRGLAVPLLRQGDDAQSLAKGPGPFTVSAGSVRPSAQWLAIPLLRQGDDAQSLAKGRGPSLVPAALL